MASDQDDFDAWLQALPDKLEAHLSDVVREQAEQLSDAQRRALQSLEQSPDETGHLEESCTVVRGNEPTEWVVVAGGDLTTGEVREGSGVPYDYSEAFEFGSSHQPARPFFWPTYRARKDDINEALQNAVNEVIND
ncbi:HK97-gp10 family putative phage morphogenesis protein [Bradyrhizobium sp. 33ap4]|uniref:HK97-gp10 family putative phage morphogenesis protein n=1 Tax=Bradyrhizobium sp. 33ap4 TaxID=3061630 RepID=UPI0029303AD0|nr:HK97-gp10 family putative phage morphogenesis protein [Bradyrhizobium sp. 33ap4]